MITFWNDHLVSPEFCKLLYDVVPVELHVPVVFTAHGEALPRIDGAKRLRPSLGTCYHGRLIGLHLQSIFADGVQGYTIRETSLWRRLVETGLHEFGHVARPCDHITGWDYMHNYDLHQKVEAEANLWRDEKMRTILEWDRNLRQPWRLGPYMDGRLCKSRLASQRNPDAIDWRRIQGCRAKQAGGQLTTGDVARILRAHCTRNRHYGYDNDKKFRDTNVLDTRLIWQKAGDLAGVCVDGAGRRHHFYVWADLPLIEERLRGTLARRRLALEVEDVERLRVDLLKREKRLEEMRQVVGSVK